MSRRRFIAGLGASAAAVGALFESQHADARQVDTRRLAGILTGRGEVLHSQIGLLLINAKAAMAVGDRARARQIALELAPLSQRDPKWFTYSASYQLAVILVETTDRRDRKAWVFANRGVVECFPGMIEGDMRDNYRTMGRACFDLLTADAAGPPLLPKRDRATAADLLLIVSGVTSGKERVAWAQYGRKESLRLGSEALAAWSVDNTTPRFAAAGVAVSGDWKGASAAYEKALLRSTGAMPKLASKSGSTMAGLRGIVGGVTTLEAEAATVFAMAGRFDRAVEVLEQSRRHTLNATRAAAAPLARRTALQLESQLTSSGVVVVQPITNIVGTFALVSVQRKGKLQRFVAFDSEYGGFEFFCRMITSGKPHFFKDGLVSAYQDARKIRGSGGQRQIERYVDRATADAGVLTGAIIRAALQKAKVGPQEDVLIILPAAMALLPISLTRSGTGPTLGQAFQLRFADSLLTAATAEDNVRRMAKVVPSVAFLTEDSATSGLRHIPFEIACVSSCFPKEARAVYGLEQVHPPMLAAIDNAKYAHIANHASWNYQHPERSGLALSRKKVATVSDIQNLNLAAPPRLVFLSACETGLVNIKANLDEFSGPLTAFLGAGCGGAIGSLWPVHDTATALLSARFYDEHIRLQRAPADALKRSQQWLQTSTVGSFRAFVDDKVAREQITPDEAEPMSTALIDLSEQARPFEHPYYWGGFQYYGR